LLLFWCLASLSACEIFYLISFFKQRKYLSFSVEARRLHCPHGGRHNASSEKKRREEKKKKEVRMELIDQA
jgi:hypothetical protein